MQGHAGLGWAGLGWQAGRQADRQGGRQAEHCTLKKGREGRLNY